MSMGIGGISAMIDQTNASAAGSKANALQDRLGSNLSNASEEELMSVCKEFEAYFVEQVMKEVEKTIPKDEEEDASMAQLTDYFKEEMIQNLSEQICEQQELGLAQQMYEQMKRNYNLYCRMARVPQRVSRKCPEGTTSDLPDGTYKFENIGCMDRVHPIFLYGRELQWKRSKDMSVRLFSEIRTMDILYLNWCIRKRS